MKQGCFITVEGTEGAGKTTALTAMASHLRDRDIDLVVTREPGGTPFGERLRGVLLDPATGSLAVESELLLMFAARAQHLHQVIRPALDNGQWVLCDRFTDASFAYQGGGRGLPFQRIEQLEQWLHNDLQPDLTLLFDLPVELGLERAAKRNQPDRFEQEQVEFFTAVREGYYRRLQGSGGRIQVVDATKTVEQVKQQVNQLLDGIL